MLVRSLLIYVCTLFASLSYANEANWNCQQDKKTKAWNCVGTADSAGQAALKPEPRPLTNNEPAQDESPKQVKPQEIEPSPEGTATYDKPEIRQTPETQPPVSTKTDTTEAPVAQETEKVPQKLGATETLPPVSPGSKVPAISEASLPEVLSASEKPVSGDSAPTVAASGGNRRGWQCDTKGEDGNWNCQLVGADPKGEARVVESEGPGFTVFDPAFDSKEELVFNTLRDRFKNNPWGNCTIQLGTQKYFLPDKKQRDYADIDMNSNAAEVYDNEIGTYRGNVDIKRADQRASSNAANYDSISELLDLHGNVFYSEDELSLYTESANIKLASDEAKMRDTLFISPTTPIRGKASAVYRDSKLLSRYKDAAYTSCEPGNQDWVVHATDLKMNKKTGEGSAKNAWVEFKGIPVFYSPYLNFPIDDRRKTGFFAPSFGNTQKGGFNLSAPFYWNIAPNYDATIRPRYYSKRGDGLLYAADFRYLTEKTKGLISAEFLPNDNVLDPVATANTTPKKDVFVNKDRYLATIKNNTHFTKNISANLDLNYVSDLRYFSELGNALSFPNFSHVRSYADASYIDKGISLTGIVESFQTIDPNLLLLGGRLKPYRRLPQINLNLDHAFESIPANIGLENEYVYFQHDDSRLPDGYRFNVKPYASFPLKTANAFLTPKIALEYTHYLLNNQQLSVADSIGRTVPIASIDSGLFLEKDINLFGNSYLHTLEPRLFYLYIPKVNQSDIPIFDTSLYDFQYDSLFRENRYNGSDRIQNANQITAALSSRLIDSETGLEKLKFNVGQTYYFQNRDVVGPVVRVGTDFLDNAVQTSTFSPVVAELSSQINKHLSVQTGLQWDPHYNQLVRGNASVQIVNNPGEVLNLGYTYRKSYLINDALDSALAGTLTSEEKKRFNDYKNGPNSFLYLHANDIIQSDVSLHWPIYDDWSLVGRWQYSILLKQTQDVFIGFEKENCCWRFRIIGREYINNLPTGNNLNGTLTSKLQPGIFFQIEFKGLTGIGNAGDLGDFFTQSIPGYLKKDY